MQRKCNLIISNGYYTTIVAMAILKQLKIDNNPKYLLAYFKQLEDSFTQNVDLSKEAWGIDKTIDYNTHYINNKFSFIDFHQDIKGAVLENVLIPINSSSKLWFKGLKEYYPKANFIFYEEGLLSYVKPILDLELKKIISSYSCFFNNFNKDFLSLVSSHFKEHKSTFNVIDLKYFTASLNNLKSLLNISFFGLKKSKNVLFLPQYYHNSNPKYNAQKLKEYFSIIKELLSKGYKVLIKDHPKISIDNYLKLYLENEKNIEHVVKLSNITQFPVELFLNDLNIDLVFSVYSTTLLSASSNIFNLPVFTSYKMLQERINSFSLYPSITCSLVKQTTPDLSSFLAYYRNDAKAYYNKFINETENNFQCLTYFKLLIKFLLKS